MGARGGSFGVHAFVSAALAAAAVAAFGLVQVVGASGGGTASSFVPIVPCRLVDTRQASAVGPRTTPMGPADTATFAVWGTNGGCTIPTSATGIASNVTAVGATAASYLTLYPADVAQPSTSNLNPAPGQPPTPNQVTVGLSATGAIKLYNNSGSVDVIIDIVGYYEPSTSGPAGPQGPPGPPGANGTNGTNAAAPARVIWVATANGDFTSVKAALAAIGTTLPAASYSTPYVIKIAPGLYAEPGGIDLKDYVDIEGSGQSTAALTCACGSSTSPFTNGSSATIRADGASLHAEVRNLSVYNTGTNTNATGIWTHNISAHQVLLRDVNVTVNASNDVYGVFNSTSSPDMIDLTATAVASGVPSTNSWGTYNAGGSAPLMSRVTATASGGTAGNFGAYNNASSPVMRDITATANGPSFNFGVYNYAASAPTMSNIVALGTDGTVNVGIQNKDSSSPTMNTVTTTGVGGIVGRGLVNDASTSVVVRNATITGSTASVYNVTSSAVTISGSTLSGAAVSGSGFTCHFNTDENGMVLAEPTCAG